MAELVVPSTFCTALCAACLRNVTHETFCWQQHSIGVHWAACKLTCFVHLPRWNRLLQWHHWSTISQAAKHLLPAPSVLLLPDTSELSVLLNACGHWQPSPIGPLLHASLRAGVKTPTTVHICHVLQVA